MAAWASKSAAAANGVTGGTSPGHNAIAESNAPRNRRVNNQGVWKDITWQPSALGPRRLGCRLVRSAAAVPGGRAAGRRRGQQPADAPAEQPAGTTDTAAQPNTGQEAQPADTGRTRNQRRARTRNRQTRPALLRSRMGNLRTTTDNGNTTNRRN